MAAEDDIARLIAEKAERERTAKEKAENRAREIAEGVARDTTLQTAAKERWTDIVDVVQDVHSAYATKAQNLGIVVTGGQVPYSANAFQSYVSNTEGTLKHTILISMSARNTLHCRIDTDNDGRRSQGQTSDMEGRKDEIEAVYAEIVRQVMTSSA